MKKCGLQFARRFHRLPLLILFLILSGCGTAKPIPDWLNTSHTRLESYKNSYLTGNEKIAAVHFNSAISEIKKSGNLQLLARAYLTQMALSTAVLGDSKNGEYLQIEKVSPDPQNRNFYVFLKGDVAQVDEKVLPSQYEGICRSIKTDRGGYLQEIEKIKDPLSQLIVIGMIVRIHHDDEAILKKAIDVASGQGWKKALLVYLEKLKFSYEGKNETERALNIEQRIRLIDD